MVPNCQTAVRKARWNKPLAFSWFPKQSRIALEEDVDVRQEMKGRDYHPPSDSVWRAPAEKPLLVDLSSIVAHGLRWVSGAVPAEAGQLIHG